MIKGSKENSQRELCSLEILAGCDITIQGLARINHPGPDSSFWLEKVWLYFLFDDICLSVHNVVASNPFQNFRECSRCLQAAGN